MIGFLCVVCVLVAPLAAQSLSPLAVSWTPWPRLLGRRVHHLG